MQNIDLIFYTVVLTVLFILFGIGTYHEFKTMNKEGFDENGEVGGAQTFLQTVSSIFTMSPYKKGNKRY